MNSYVGSARPWLGRLPVYAMVGLALFMPVPAFAQTIDLETTLQRAVQEGPRVQIAAISSEAIRAKSDQSNWWLTPALAADIENIGAGEEYTLRIDQPIALGNQSRKQLAVYRSQADMSALNLALVRAEVRADARQAYYQLIAMQRQHRLARERLQAAQAMHAAVLARMASGAISGIDADRAALHVQESDVAQIETARRLAEGIEQLPLLWGGPAGDVTAIVDDPQWSHSIAPAPDLNKALEIYRSGPRGQLRAQSRVQLEMQRAAANAAGRPDLTVGAGYRRLAASDQNALILGLSVPIALNNPNRGEVAGLDVQLASVDALRQAEETATRQQVSESIRSMGAVQREYSQLRSSTLPALQRILAGVQEGYKLGRFTYAELLSAHSDLFRAYAREIELTETYWITLSHLSKIIGTDASLR